MKNLYLDDAATTKPAASVLWNYNETAKEYYGNPSSTVYTPGWNAHLLLEDSRKKLADTLGVDSETIYFTSGATEGANWALRGIITRGSEKLYHLYVSEIEHPCIYNTAKWLHGCGVETTFLPVGIDGKINLDTLEAMLAKDTKVPIVCTMLVNNEIGVIQDIKKISEIVHRYYGLLISDITQAYTHIPINLLDLGIDITFASAHKFGGVRGCGFLYCNSDWELEPLMFGGHQEKGMRPGTENLPAISSMCQQAYWLCNNMEWRQGEIKQTRDRLLKALKFHFNCSLNHGEADWIINITLNYEYVDALQIISLLDMDNIYLSAGSACQTGQSDPSRVLKAIGLSDYSAERTLRITINENITEDDCEHFIKQLGDAIQTLCK